jgi:hypothetical protein
MMHVYAIKQLYDQTNPNEIIRLFENKIMVIMLRFLNLMIQMKIQFDHNHQTRKNLTRDVKRSVIVYCLPLLEEKVKQDEQLYPVDNKYPY